MKALCWFGSKDVRVETVPDPQIINPHDAILRITSTAICGSDIHLYDGYIPTLQAGDILGHEFMGEVVEVGKQVSKISVGDRVAVPFNIACGHCFFCNHDKFSLCDNSNPNAAMQEKVINYATSGLFGYSHAYGGYAGAQAEYVRVPYADVGPLKIPSSLPDEKVLFLTDILPTGYMAAENCDIQSGDTVAVWGCGPVGIFAMKCARLLGAERVLAIDSVPERMALAQSFANAEPVHYDKVDIQEKLREMTGGRGPDSCIDAVGMEAHGTDVEAVYEKVKQTLKLQADRPMALREIIDCCRKGGTVSIPGVYAGFIDKFPFGIAFAKGLTFKMGQTHTHKYMKLLLNHIENGDIEPERIISHTLPLSKAAYAYDIFAEKKDNCTKVVLKP